jgi:hypothetical protein
MLLDAIELPSIHRISGKKRGKNTLFLTVTIFWQVLCITNIERDSNGGVMGSHVKQIPNDESFWISLVETNMRLGWERCLVPPADMKPEVAKALADRLNVRLEVTDEGYVFTKMDMWIQRKRDVNQHRSAGSTSRQGA